MFKALLLITLVCAASLAVTEGKKLKAKATKITDCESTNAVLMYADIKEVNEKENSYSGNFTLPYDITPDIEVKVDVSKQKMNGQWENNVINIKKKDPCKLMNEFGGELWWKEQDRLKMPRGECPIKKGTYHDKDVMVDLSSFDIPQFLAGKLKVKMQAMKDGNVDLCKIVDVTLS